MSTSGFVEVVTFGFGAVILGKLFETKAPKPTTQRIGELSNQTAKEGEPRPIIWGRVRPISGNIMHSSPPRIITREVQGQSSGGGKGGKKKPPKQYEERVLRTYAIRICEGPITAIIRVWRNNKLIYDARGNEWGEKNNSVFLSRARFYLGAWAQMPDPTLESQWGAGNVPAYRGTCYMVVPDEDLTDLGGAIPQYIYEVERAEGVALTSLLYDVECIDDATGVGVELIPGLEPVIESGQSTGLSVLGGDLRQLLREYKDWPVELTESMGLVVVSADMSTPGAASYQNWPPEALQAEYLSLQSGEMRVGLIKYQNWPLESAEATSVSVTGGSM